MIKPDIPLYKLDLTGSDPFNKVSSEYMFRSEVKNNNIVIPPKAPFYQKSFKMFDKTGKPLVEGEDYEFYGIMGKLTQYTGKPVGLFVRLLKDELTEWYVEYQVVGNFSKLTNEILNMLHSIYEDDRFVLYENIQNKPLWFVPEIHQHDLAYDIFGFTDLVTQLNRITTFQAVSESVSDELLATFQSHLSTYIDGHKAVLMKLINSHITNKQDAHGVNGASIGLGNVDNYLTATLEETIEGLRDDLHITPYNAAIAADAAAGRNDKLFPSGSLPLLRYGSDTFIPPTISGSFEGMGGLYQQICAVVESDGTLLALQRRNNGKTKGLYFLRSLNWTAAKPVWEFTGYRYQHPTAIAAGATLNRVINGSNDQIMIVGDEDKNIWFWCETKGTLNPDRHILHRITDTNFLANNKDFNRAFVMTPDDPSELAIVVFGLNSPQLKSYRPATPTDSETGGGTRVLEAFLFFVLVGDEFRQAKMTYPMANGKQYTLDDIFTPYERVQGLGPNGEKGISEYHVKWATPILQSWTDRMLMGHCAKTWQAHTYSFMMGFRIWSRDFAGKSFSGHIPYRAIIKVTKATTPTIEFTPGVGERQLYTLDMNNISASPEYLDYMRWKNLTGVNDTSDMQGYSTLHNGRVMLLGSLGNSFLPVRGILGTFRWLDVENGLVDQPPTTTWSPMSAETCKEYNPVGLGSLFLNQVHMTMDTDDWTKGAVMARQLGQNGKTEWICRPMAFLTDTWNHNGVRSTMDIAGKSVKYFPYVSQIYKTNLGPQLVLNIPGMNSNNPKVPQRYTQVFGVDAWSTLLGLNSKGQLGDGKLIRKNKIKLVNDIVTFTPTIVYNVSPSIDRDFKPVLAAAGFDVTEVGNSWTIIQVMAGDTGEEFHLFQAGDGSGKTVKVAAVLCKITGKGTAVKDPAGYDYYSDVTVQITSGVKIMTYDTDAVFSRYTATNFDTSSQFEHSATCLTAPNNTPNGTCMAVVRGLGRYNRPTTASTLDIIYEYKSDGSEIIRMANFRQTPSGIDSKWVISPGSGQGNPVVGRAMMEGAGIVSQDYQVGSSTTLYDAMVGNSLKDEYQVGMSNLLVSQFVVYFNKMDNVLLAGKMYDIPATYIDIQTVDASPANKVFYAYLIYTNGQAQYLISKDVRPETTTQALIATITTGASEITTIVPYNRFTMDGAQVTASRQGSGILSSSGSVFDVGNTSTILLDSDFVP